MDQKNCLYSVVPNIHGCFGFHLPLPTTTVFISTLSSRTSYNLMCFCMMRAICTKQMFTSGAPASQCCSAPFDNISCVWMLKLPFTRSSLHVFIAGQDGNNGQCCKVNGEQIIKNNREQGISLSQRFNKPHLHQASVLCRVSLLM